MSRLIDADAFIAKLNHVPMVQEAIRKAMDTMPTIEERKTGARDTAILFDRFVENMLHIGLWHQHITGVTSAQIVAVL